MADNKRVAVIYNQWIAGSQFDKGKNRNPFDCGDHMC